MVVRKVGRPPVFESAEEIEKKIEAYFKDCAGTPVLGSDGKPVTNIRGEVILMGAHPPTVTGLALALGFTNRQSLLNYQAKKEFFDTITRAKARIEQYAEERLFDKDGAAGAKFSLTNNFDGWQEKKSVDADIKGDTTIHIELTDE